ncbi:MAG: rRNA methyltransferase [Myxococcaceae bacterium]|nr:rRNA methyltransferase [Myxococcaceae bacterium]MCI0669487.1 rRNA methyltransferase [Myxococcaceae bacterium]
MPLPPFRFVLLRPRNAENLGAAARALKNCGFSDWVWVRPEVEDFAPAYRLAVHAGDVLDAARREDTLEAAVADCVWVVGTSSRGVEGKRRLSPRVLAPEAVERATSGPVAIVFGDERSGMTNEEVYRCHDLSSVPTDPAQPSVNLAQAVLLYAYELRVAALSAPAGPSVEKIAATEGALKHLEETVGQVLRAAGFLVQEGRHGLRDLMAPLRRSRLGRDEARLWSAAMHSVLRRLKGWGAGPRPPHPVPLPEGEGSGEDA